MKHKKGYLVTRLSQEEVDALPAGSEIEISWEFGGNQYFKYWTFKDYLGYTRVVNKGSANPLRFRIIECPIVTSVTKGEEPEMVRVYGYKEVDDAE